MLNLDLEAARWNRGRLKCRCGGVVSMYSGPLPKKRLLKPTSAESGSNSSFHRAQTGISSVARFHVESKERMNGSWDA